MEALAFLVLNKSIQPCCNGLRRGKQINFLRIKVESLPKGRLLFSYYRYTLRDKIP